jgi:O-antigen/teichoic acid export membrane protein
MTKIDVRKKAIGGIAWSSFGNIGSHLLQFMTTLVLARILAPNDFGLVAMANTYTVLINTINDFGISSSIVHKQDVEERHLSTAFYMNIAIGTVLMTGTCLVAGFIADFYSNEFLEPILIALSVVFFINSTKCVHTALLIKKLQYHKIAFAGLLEMLTNSTIAISLAFCGVGVWSIVIGRIAGVVVGRVYIMAISDWSPRWIYDFKAFKELFSFGANAMGGNFIGYFIVSLDNIVLGHFGGSALLGVYSMAYNISMMPQKKISSVVSWVAFPLLSKIQDDKDRVANVYIELISLVSFITFPILGFIFAVAPEFVAIVLGERWLSAQLPLQILSFAGMALSVSATSGSLFYSMGRPDIELKIGGLSLVLLLAALGCGVNFGIEGVAIAVTAQYCTLLVIYMTVISNFIHKPVLQIYNKVFLNFLSTVLMILVVTAIKAAVKEHLEQGKMDLAFSLLVAVIAYLSISAVFNRKALRQLSESVGLRRFSLLFSD